MPIFGLHWYASGLVIVSVFFTPVASVLGVSIYVLVGDLYPCSKRAGGVAIHVHMYTYMFILG